MYKKGDLEILKRHLKDKFMNGEAEGYEIAITLLTLTEAKKIKEEDILPILQYVHSGNIKGVLTALVKASDLVDDLMIKKIIKALERK